MNESPTLAVVLNKCQAIVGCGHARVNDLAAFLGKPASRVSEWLNRHVQPSGEIAFRMHDWAGKMSNQIAVSNDAGLQTRYRSAYRNLSRLNKED